MTPCHNDLQKRRSVVITDTPLEDHVETPLFIIDWEMAELGPRSLDYGQMLGEMYALSVYGKSEAGLWLLQGFSEGLSLKDEALAFRIAAQSGLHLVSFDSVIPTWGTLEQRKQCARIGRDLIVHARQRDRKWFEQSDLACLFAYLE